MPTRKLSLNESRIVVEVPSELKARLERHLTPPGAARPPYGAMKRFFERKIREFLIEQQKKEDAKQEQQSYRNLHLDE